MVIPITIDTGSKRVMFCFMVEMFLLFIVVKLILSFFCEEKKEKKFINWKDCFFICSGIYLQYS